jgi:hypothetical protein
MGVLRSPAANRSMKEFFAFPSVLALPLLLSLFSSLLMRKMERPSDGRCSSVRRGVSNASEVVLIPSTSKSPVDVLIGWILIGRQSC